MTGHDYHLEVTGASLLGYSWPVAHARAVVAIAHGINEHIGRYQHVAEALNDAGFSVVGVDHRGHGRSLLRGKRTARFRKFDLFVDDYLALTESIRKETDRPLIALGHSMGGLIVTRAVLRTQDRFAAMVLSGPALKLPVPFGPWRLRLELAVARLFPFLNLPDPGATSGRISRDHAILERHRTDPLGIHDPVTFGVARQIYLLSEETRRRAEEIRLPLLVMHGEADPITVPSGSREFVENASSADKEFVCWPEDLHEIFNELDREAVLKHLTDWLQARFPAPLPVA